MTPKPSPFLISVNNFPLVVDSYTPTIKGQKRKVDIDSQINLFCL